MKGNYEYYVKFNWNKEGVFKVRIGLEDSLESIFVYIYNLWANYANERLEQWTNDFNKGLCGNDYDTYMQEKHEEALRAISKTDMVNKFLSNHGAYLKVDHESQLHIGIKFDNENYIDGHIYIAA